MGIAYVTLERLRHALDSKESAYNDARLLQCIDSGSRAAEGILRRRFYPEIATRYFPWPEDRADTLWLDGDANDLASLTSATSGGTTVTFADIIPQPPYGPPYDRLALASGSGGSWLGGDEALDANAITGLWCGCAIVETADATTAEALDSSETGVDIGASSLLGIGSIIRIDSERMIVTGRSLLDTGQNTAGALTSSNADRLLAVASGAAFVSGEIILVEAERMQVLDIAGNNLIVRRAVDGSVLAAHASGVDVYALRTLTVQRGALGTTAAAHNTAASVLVFEVPALVQELALALAMVAAGAGQAGYTQFRRSGDTERETARSTGEIRRDAMRVHGRGPRVGAV